MNEKNNIFKYIAGGCFAVLTVLNVISMIQNGFDFWNLCLIIGFALIAASLLAAFPALTVAGSALYGINAIRTIIQDIETWQITNSFLWEYRHTLARRLYTSLMLGILGDILFLVVAVLLLVVSLKPKLTKQLGFAAGITAAVRFLSLLVSNLLYATLSDSVVAFLGNLVLIVGALMIGLSATDYTTKELSVAGTGKTTAVEKNAEIQADRLNKLKSLLDSGVITQEEFDKKVGSSVDAVSVDAGVNTTLNQFDSSVKKTNDAKNKKSIKMIAVAIAAVIIVMVGAFTVPKIFVSVDELCAQGNYAKAYQKASDDQKGKVYAENVIAYLSEKTSDLLLDPESFKLLEGYYHYSGDDKEDSFGQQAVLYISGNNRYGTATTGYFLWTYDDSSDEWEYNSRFYSKEDEYYDDYIDSIGKTVLRYILAKGIKLDQSQVKNINAQFTADTLNKVELIDIKSIDRSVFTTPNSGN